MTLVVDESLFIEQVEWIYGDHGAISVVLDLTPPNTVASSIATPLPIPAGAVIDAARFEVVVDPPGRARLADVAEVRAVDPGDDGESSRHVVDFKVLQTVSEVEMSFGTPGLYVLSPWIGTEFGDPVMYYSESIDGFRSFAFADIRTERLLLDLSSPVPSSALADTEVVLPSAPASVEILVNGTRAWFRAIDAAAPRTHPDIEGTHSLAEVVDLRAALQAAIDESGSSTVELRSTSAAQLQFRAAPLQFFRTHRVEFSNGPSRSFTAPDEGQYDVDLPLPGQPGVEAWDIHAVELTLRADIGDLRVQPAVGPDLLADLELVLGDDRKLLVKLPGSVVERFGEVTGIRLPMRAGAGGAELAGELRADDTTVTPSRPGDVLAEQSFAPVTIDDDTVAYRTLTLAQPFEPPADPEQSAAAWAALRASRGEVVWSVSQSDPTDGLADAELRWEAPSGVARRLSAIVAAGTSEEVVLSGALRVVGAVDPNRPLDALTVEVLGRPDRSSLTPFDTGSELRLALETPISPADQATGSDHSLRLRFIAAAPGEYTIERALVVYTDPAVDLAFVPTESGGQP